MRASVRERRSARSVADAARADDALRDLATACSAQRLGAFVPVRGEPGSMSVLEALGASRELWLPIAGRIGTPMRWGRFTHSAALACGPFGLLQPTEAEPLDLTDLDLVLAPALALSPDGRRLGQGGGYYDRALAGVPPERIMGVVHDDEIVDDLPVEPHDLQVGWICTPSGIRETIPTH